MKNYKLNGCMPSSRKKIFALLVCMMFFVFPLMSHAQLGLSYGAKVGMTNSYFDDEQPNGNAMGLTAGAFVKYPLSDALAVQAEVNYLQQGGILTQDIVPHNYGYFFSYDSYGYSKVSNVTIHNLEIPVMAKYALPFASDISPSIFVGPSIALRLGATENYEKVISSEPGSMYYYTSQQIAEGYEVTGQSYEFFQFGINAGLSSEIGMGSKVFVVDMRYRYGILPVKVGYSPLKANYYMGDIRSHSVVFSLGLVL